MKIVSDNILESVSVKEKLLSETKTIFKAGKVASDVLRNQGKILLCGNGGSAADAQHIAAELVVRYKTQNNRPALPAISLSTDPSFLTAASNDLGYEDIFVRSVEAFGRKEDLLVGISTSGNSRNIINAVKKAKEMGLKVLLLLGGDGGHLKGKGNIEICVPSKKTARIQECHILIGHILCSIIEKELFDLD